jgi:CMP-N-acetylneuraminic acid synthetase
MINENNILVIIPARSGSKRLKNKNILKIKNIPMVIRCAMETKKSKYVDNVFVSSESKKILNICKKYNIDIIKRPKHLSKDHVEKQEVIVHAVKLLKNKLKPQIVISLQPNSPQFKHQDLDKALKFFVKYQHSKDQVNELISINKNKIQNGCFRIMKLKTVFQKTLSTKIGVFFSNYIDVHDKKDFKKITKLLSK